MILIRVDWPGLVNVAQVEYTLPHLVQDVSSSTPSPQWSAMVKKTGGVPGWIKQKRVDWHRRSAYLHAVAAALHPHWSNGLTEGQINRLKMLKPQMHHAAGIDLPLAR